MNDTWGYKSDDHNWKSSETLIRNLIDIASKGGNYLLNVGPTAEGLIPEPSVERLRDMGRWMKVNGESIWGTQASPFTKTPWGRCTQKRLDGGKTRLYLHVFQWPQDGKLVIPDLANQPLAARLLVGDTKLEFAAGDRGAVIQLPAEMPDKTATVVALDIAGEARIAKLGL
jgi:alpha-L-fucosidase